MQWINRPQAPNGATRGDLPDIPVATRSKRPTSLSLSNIGTTHAVASQLRGFRWRGSSDWRPRLVHGIASQFSHALCSLQLSRNATAGDSLGCQSEVTRQNKFAESQSDGMCGLRLRLRARARARAREWGDRQLKWLAPVQCFITMFLIS